MRVHAAVYEDVDSGEAPVSGVRVKSDDSSVWRELIDEVQQIAHAACRNVPPHLRADVESAAMVGLMEAVRDFDQIEAGHFDQYVMAKVWNALQAEADRFEPASSRAGQWDVLPPSTQSARKGPTRITSEGEHWSEPAPAAVHVPLPDETAHEDILTAEAAFVGSYAVTALRWGLAQLDKRERLVLRLAYKRGLALTAIAKRLSVSTPRAYQIRIEAERKLARLLRKSPSIGQMTSAPKSFDWDDHTEETVRARGRLSIA